MSAYRHVPPRTGAGASSRVPLVVAMSLRPEGNTGVHTHVRQLRRYLDKQGVATTLVTPFSWGGVLQYPAFGLRRLVVDPFSKSAGVLWHRRSHELFLRAALRRRLRTVGPCVVYAQDPLAARAALDARSGPHQKVVMAVHFRISQADEYADGGAMGRGGRAFRAVREFERKTIPRTDGLVFVSRWGMDALVDWLPEAAGVRFDVIGNFVEALAAASAQSPQADLVTTGRLEPAKNHRFLLEVLAEAKRAGRPFTLDVFGDGPSSQDLERMVGELGLEKQVRFRGFRSDVRESLPRYRAYVHASLSESLPLAVIEAMAAGLPIVAADTGGISEMCEDGCEARFWPLDDPVKAATTLVELLDNESDRARAAQAAISRFHRDFEAEVVAPRLVSFVMG